MKVKTMPDENACNSFTINLTNRCNTWCRYCFQKSGSSGVDCIKTKDIQRILEFFKGKQNGGEKYLQLTGGEPFLHPDIFEIIKLALFFGYTLRIQTNGILLNRMTEEQMIILSSDKILIKISLDGWNVKTHERWRAKGSFVKVISGIRRLRKYNRNIGIKIVVHDLNFPEIYRMLDMCLDLGARAFSYNQLRFEGRAKCLGFGHKSIKEREIVEKLLPYFKEKKYQPLLNGTWIMRYYRRILEGSNVLRNPEGFYIDYDGGIYPNQSCSESERIGSIFRGSFSEEFNFNKLIPEEIPVPSDVLEMVSKFLRSSLIIKKKGDRKSWNQKSKKK